jgi:hypothetical protein
MVLSFQKKDIENLILVSETNPPDTIPYTGGQWAEMLGQKAKEKKERGLVLVGDHGIYFMSNAKGQKKVGREFPTAYAQECNPHKLDFETWWDNKTDSFGPDDGCIFFNTDTIKAWLKATKGTTCLADVTPQRVLLYPHNQKIKKDKK